MYNKWLLLLLMPMSVVAQEGDSSRFDGIRDNLAAPSILATESGSEDKGEFNAVMGTVHDAWLSGFNEANYVENDRYFAEQLSGLLSLAVAEDDAHKSEFGRYLSDLATDTKSQIKQYVSTEPAWNDPTISAHILNERVAYGDAMVSMTLSQVSAMTAALDEYEQKVRDMEAEVTSMTANPCSYDWIVDEVEPLMENVGKSGFKNGHFDWGAP
ncbi:hypothetical protein ACP3V3_16865 [Vibrio sp. PNB22_3_1]